MDLQKLGQGIAIVGIAGAALCLLWWGNFYSSAVGRGDSLGHFFGCIIVDNFQCGLVKNIARLAGYTPYEPLFFWLSAVIFIIGALMNYSSRPQ